jgi:glycerate kinase
MGAGMVGFFGGTLRQGIDVVLDTVDFDIQVADASLVLTGEGRLDAQSLGGKVVVGVARRAARQQVPVIAVVGDISDDYEGVFNHGVSAVFSINNLAIPFSQAKPRSERDLTTTMQNLCRVLAL